MAGCSWEAALEEELDCSDLEGSEFSFKLDCADMDDCKKPSSGELVMYSIS